MYDKGLEQLGWILKFIWIFTFPEEECSGRPLGISVKMKIHENLEIGLNAIKCVLIYS